MTDIDPIVERPVGDGEEASALEAYRAAVRWVAADSWDGCSDCIRILQMARSLDDVDWTPDQHAEALKRLYERSGTAALSTPTPTDAGEPVGLREAQAIVAVANRYEGKSADDMAEIPVGVLRAAAMTINGLAFAPMLDRMAADRIQSDAKIIEELRVALKPFADCAADWISDDEDDEEWAKFRLLIKDYRRARAALEPKKEQNDG